MTQYLTIVEVIFIYEALMKRYGGAYGIRDMGALEAALFRPQSGYYETILQEAAALWESLSQNHPFIDGNKRVAFAATHVFLKINHITLTAAPEVLEHFVLDHLKQGEFEYKAILQWLQRYTIVPVDEEFA
jgi:death-on-curing protein